MKPRRIHIESCRVAGARGFTLVEVLVSLIIIAVGLLGLAKIQTLAYANTGVASQESLAALQAASLAAAMRANRGYWATVTTAYGTPYTYDSTNVLNDLDAVMGTPYSTSCSLATGGTYTAALCTPQQLAAYDLQNWVTSLNATLPHPKATINCTAASGTSPQGCSITVTWTEENVAIDTQSAGQVINAPPSYTLYVVP